jgi:hypothetical protein
VTTVAVPPAWGEFAELRVELGANVRWSGAATTWGSAVWGRDVWTGLFEPDYWRDVTAAVMSFDYDTGRQGLLDPGDVGTASMTLLDLAGDFGLVAHRAIGALVRAWARCAKGERLLFFGKIADADYVGDLGAPVVTLRCVDPLGIAFAGETLFALGPQTLTQRLELLLDDALWPRVWRDLQLDPTGLGLIRDPGLRIDEARRAVESAGGILWAEGQVISYRGRDYTIDPETPPALSITTDQPGPGASPSQLGYREAIADTANRIRLETIEPVLYAEAIDPTSIAAKGPRWYRRTDLCTVGQGVLDALAQRILRLRAWPSPRLEPLQVLVHDTDSAPAVLVRLGDIVEATYTGSAPGTARAIVGGIGHHVTPEEWAVTFRTFYPDRAEPPEPPELPEPREVHADA